MSFIYITVTVVSVKLYLMSVVYNGLFAVIEPCSTAGCVLLTTVVMQEEKNMDSARTEVSVCTQGQHLFIHWGLFSVQGLDTPV